jgi:hypothetical protein
MQFRFSQIVLSANYINISGGSNTSVKYIIFGHSESINFAFLFPPTHTKYLVEEAVSGAVTIGIS